MHEQSYVLVFPVLQDGRIVLLAKKQRKIGAGMWNGYGGKVELDDPTVVERAALELWEKAQISADPMDLSKVAEIRFHFTKEAPGRARSARVHIFLLKKWSGVPRSTETMKDPTWFPMSIIPFDCMMPGDRYFLPLILSGEKLTGDIWFAEDEKSVLRHELHAADFGAEH